jgi:predicted dehydrogenase
MSRRTNRREFLKQSAALAAGIGFWAAGGVSLRGDSKSPNEKLNFACIGVGGKGGSDTDHVAGLGNMIALCDIDDHTLDGKFNALSMKFPDLKKFNDFREMLDKLGDKIDAVTVSTPDHTHAIAAITAMKMGKHVYCQKPLTYSVSEARLMRETAAKKKVCTQMGNQGSAEDGLRQAVEVIQSGAIGPVTEVHVWTNRPVWPQAPDVTMRPPEQTPPPHVHWDLWLGPAPVRPYNGDKQKNGHPPYHDFNWRGWLDFGTGAIGDMACHTANLPFRALKLAQPTSAMAEAGDVNPETYPSWARVVLEFPARGDMPPVKFTWYEGKRDGKKMLPPEDLIKDLPRNGKGELQGGGSGSLLVGSKGMLFSPDDYGAQYLLLPAKNFEGFKPPAATLPRNGKGDMGMKMEWVEAIRAGKPEMAYSNFDYAATLTEAILLGNVAMRAGKKLEYDGKTGKITNDDKANQHLGREYRKGWTL